MLRQPTWTRLLPDRWIVAIATLGPLGRLPGPGTWGSLAGCAWFVAVGVPLGTLLMLPLTALLLYLTFALCGEAERRLAKVDPPEVNLDEFACMPIVLLGFDDVFGAPGAWIVLVGGFVMFRVLDITKPLGIRRLQRFTGGAGVLLDDLAAALVACAALQVIVRLTPLVNWAARITGAESPL